MIIKQSTARTIIVGPVLDSTGAAKTDEVVASIKVTKNGTVGAADGATTLTHDHAGKYKLAMAAGDTDTLGVLEISLNSGTNDMPVKAANVVPANVYDSLVAGSDALDVSLIQWLGVAPLVLSSQRVASHVGAQDNIDFGALQKASLNAATPASVTGAVGSVTGSVGSVVAAVTLANGAHGGAAASLNLAGGMTANITGNLSGSVGSVTGAVGSVTGAVGSVTGSVGSVTGAVGSVTGAVTVGTNNDKTGYSLAAGGLDSITATEPSGKPTTFPGWIMWLVQRFRRSSKTPTTLLVKTEAGATVTTQTVTDDGAGTETLGAPS